MSQTNSRKRKGDHLDEHPQQLNRGYLSINMLSNIHSVQNNAVITSVNEPNHHIHHYHQSTQHNHPNATATKVPSQPKYFLFTQKRFFSSKHQAT